MSNGKEEKLRNVISFYPHKPHLSSSSTHILEAYRLVLSPLLSKNEVSLPLSIHSIILLLLRSFAIPLLFPTASFQSHPPPHLLTRNLSLSFSTLLSFTWTTALVVCHLGLFKPLLRRQMHRILRSRYLRSVVQQAAFCCKAVYVMPEISCKAENW